MTTIVLQYSTAELSLLITTTYYQLMWIMLRHANLRPFPSVVSLFLKYTKCPVYRYLAMLCCTDAQLFLLHPGKHDMILCVG